MYEKITKLKDMDLIGKKVLMRVDFNVPQDKTTREVTSDARIIAALPSIKYVLDNGAEQLILTAHLGKPAKLAKKGEDYTEKLSLDKVAEKLSELGGEKVTFVRDYIEGQIPNDRLVLLENIRFNHELEQSKEDSSREMLAQRLASFADVFVNDAFGTCHRKEASVYDVVKYLPSGIGLLVEKEITQLSRLLHEPDRPYIALLGGAKVEDKIKVIEALAKKVDAIYIMGAMEYAFRKADGKEVGSSLCEGVETARATMQSEYWEKVNLPMDTVIAKKEGEIYTDIQTVNAGEIPEGYAGLDIGEKTIRYITEQCGKAGTIFWNGPAGMFEVEPFNKGTMAIADYLAGLNNVRMVGGGDSVAAIKGREDKFTHVSTGGGASLELIEKEGHLPALDIQEEKAN